MKWAQWLDESDAKEAKKKMKEVAWQNGGEKNHAEGKALLSAWEPPVFKDLADTAFDLDFIPEIIQPVSSLFERTSTTLDKFQAAIADFSHPPPANVSSGLLVVALYMGSEVNWDARSDLLVAQIVCGLFMGEIRAHSSGMYEYSNGAWLRSKEFSEYKLSA
eukprot:13603611-Heterocapsa_arctica.AAC.1